MKGNPFASAPAFRGCGECGPRMDAYTCKYLSLRSRSYSALREWCCTAQISNLHLRCEALLTFGLHLLGTKLCGPFRSVSNKHEFMVRVCVCDESSKLPDHIGYFPFAILTPVHLEKSTVKFCRLLVG